MGMSLLFIDVPALLIKYYNGTVLLTDELYSSQVKLEILKVKVFLQMEMSLSVNFVFDSLTPMNQ